MSELAFHPRMRQVFQWFERRQVYRPSRRFVASDHELRLRVEEVSLRARDDVRLHGWHFSAHQDSPRAAWCCLLLHGNAGNISHRLLHAALLLGTGASAFLLDYRGYGRSEGRPSEEGTYLDAEAAHEWLQQRGVASGKLVVIGESLGGAVATELALRRTIAGLVLLSTFTSIPDIGREWFPWLPVRRWGHIRYDTVAKLSQVNVPVLILHSRADTWVGFHHAERNHAAARPPCWLREIPGDHNDLITVGQAVYRAALDTFLEDLERTFDGQAGPPQVVLPAR